jgi:hypothetical protein
MYVQISERKKYTNGAFGGFFLTIYHNAWCGMHKKNTGYKFTAVCEKSL